jgi:hypothetical protein
MGIWNPTVRIGQNRTLSGAFLVLVSARTRKDENINSLATNTYNRLRFITAQILELRARFSWVGGPGSRIYSSTQSRKDRKGKFAADENKIQAGGQGEGDFYRLTFLARIRGADSNPPGRGALRTVLARLLTFGRAVASE